MWWRRERVWKISDYKLHKNTKTKWDIIKKGIKIKQNNLKNKVKIILKI
jgi:hypothetical protein